MKPESIRLTIEPEAGAGIKADRQLARFVKSLIRCYGWRLVRIETSAEIKNVSTTPATKVKADSSGSQMA
ncbi:MAG: hypothetical protein AAFX06_28110 [Planctomycetota bacterium]